MAPIRHELNTVCILQKIIETLRSQQAVHQFCAQLSCSKVTTQLIRKLRGTGLERIGKTHVRCLRPQEQLGAGAAHLQPSSAPAPPAGTGVFANATLAESCPPALPPALCISPQLQKLQQHSQAPRVGADGQTTAVGRCAGCSRVSSCLPQRLVAWGLKSSAAEVNGANLSLS